MKEESKLRRQELEVAQHGKRSCFCEGEVVVPREHEHERDRGAWDWEGLIGRRVGLRFKQEPQKEEPEE